MHLKEKHGMSMIVMTERFQTESEFLEWKKDFEQETNQRYVKNTGVKKFAKVNAFIFDCHRSGFEKRPPLVQVNKAGVF